MIMGFAARQGEGDLFDSVGGGRKTGAPDVGNLKLHIHPGASNAETRARDVLTAAVSEVGDKSITWQFVYS